MTEFDFNLCFTTNYNKVKDGNEIHKYENGTQRVIEIGVYSDMNYRQDITIQKISEPIKVMTSISPFESIWRGNSSLIGLKYDEN